MALEALNEAVDYIVEASGLNRAETWLSAMRSGVEKLESLPRTSASEGELKGRTIRSKLVMNHRVFYFIEEEERLVYIIDIVHTARATRLSDYRRPLE